MVDFKTELKNDTYPGVSDDVLAEAIRSAAKIVVLTEAEYTALAVKDPTVIYIVVPA